MSRLLVWRHGRTSWNAAGRTQGQVDIELDDTGRAQAAAAADLLAAERPATIVSSDLRRAFETARALSERTGVPVRTDARLRERNYGPWEGLTDDEITVRWPAEQARSRQGLPYHVDGIESRADVGKRVSEAMLAAVDATPDGTVVVVTHGGAARFALAILLGWPEEIIGTVHGLSNCHWAELRRDASWRLYGHNLG